MAIHKRLGRALNPVDFFRTTSNPKTANKRLQEFTADPRGPEAGGLTEDLVAQETRRRAEQEALAKAKTRADTVDAAADLRRRLSLQKGRRSTIATSGRGLPTIKAESVSRPGLSAPQTVFGGF